jgi:hypothetical protein
MRMSTWLVAPAIAGVGVFTGALSALAAPTATAPPPYEIPVAVEAPFPAAVEAPVLSAPAAPPPTAPVTTGARFIRPFPVVRVAGSSVRRGAYIRLLRVTAPRGSKVDVRCNGRGCPLARRVFRPGRIRQLERFLPAGVLIAIRVTRASYIGKYVRLKIRASAAPERRDACLLPGRTRPSACPQ